MPSVFMSVSCPIIIQVRIPWLEHFCVCVCCVRFAALGRFKYDYMVLDEGHSIKNIKSSRFQRLRMVVSRHRLLLRFVRAVGLSLVCCRQQCHAMICEHVAEVFWVDGCI